MPLSSKILFEENKSLKDFTSWKVGGSAEFYYAPTSVGELKRALEKAHEDNLPVSVLGGGTNVLVSDKGVPGLVLHTHKLVGVTILDDDKDLRLEAMAGTPKSEVLKVFLKHRLEPATFLAGLPGDVAGGVVMNAGVGHKVSPKEFNEIVESFDVLQKDDNGNFREVRIEHSQAQWSYRKSRGWQPGVITRVRMRWPNQPNSEVLNRVREGNKRRKETQPLSQPSCGSVFKNPEGDHSGRLIEACGLKGYAIGGAQVSEKHANFIVSSEGATASDIAQVIRHVQKTVEKEQGIKLTNEVVYLGAFPS